MNTRVKNGQMRAAKARQGTWTVLFFLLLGISFSRLNAQTGLASPLYVSAEDRAIFDRYLSAMQAKKYMPVSGSVPISDLLIETARFFLGTPYVASTLEKEPEGLVINLREMDCTTFMENVLALTRTLQELPNESPFDTFCKHLRQIRYRDGRLTDYTDRLHYMTDWIYENARQGQVLDINREIGGIPFPVSLSFISSHPDLYKQLKGHPERVGEMADKEKEINSRTYYYLPKTKISEAASRLQDGDIVCFVTTIKGLDVTHVGLVYRTGETVSFIHASSSAKKVIINEESLQAYTERMKSNRGLLLARPTSHL